MDSKDKVKEEKEILKLSKLGFGFKLVRFTTLLSVTWIITTITAFCLGLTLLLLNTKQAVLVLGGIFLVVVYGPHWLMLWVCMFSHTCREENVSGIEEIAEAYTYFSAILNLVLNFVGCFLTVFEEQYLKAGIEFIFRFSQAGPILVLLIFLIGIFYTSKLLHGLRTHQDGHLGDYIVFRYFMLGVTIILTIVATTQFSINFSESLHETILCGFLALALGCLIFMLDVGPTIILHSIWSQESNENPKPKKIYTIDIPDTPIPDSWYW